MKREDITKVDNLFRELSESEFDLKRLRDVENGNLMIRIEGKERDSRNWNLLCGIDNKASNVIGFVISIKIQEIGAIKLKIKSIIPNIVFEDYNE